jgi:hypothetical protein
MLTIDIALDTVLAAAAAVGDDIVSSEDVVFPLSMSESPSIDPCTFGVLLSDNGV